MATDTPISSLGVSPTIPAGAAILVRQPRSGGGTTFGLVDPVSLIASGPAGQTAAQVAAQIAVALQGLVGSAPAALSTLAAIDAQLAADEGSAAGVAAIVAGHTAALAARELTANKGVANGYAPLDGTGKVPAANLPTLAGAVTSVAGRGGVVTLAVGDVSGAYAASNPAGYQTGAQVNTAIQAVVGAAPGALATLQAIDAQLANDESAASALTTIVSGHTTAIGTNTANITSNTTAIAAREQTVNKGAANGYAPLDGTGKVPAANLPAASGGGSSSTPVTTVAASGTAQALTAASAGDKAYLITLTAACTLTLSGGTTGQLQRVVVLLVQDGAGGRAVTWPSGIKWATGLPPTTATGAGQTTIATLMTPDGGSTWFGSY